MLVLDLGALYGSLVGDTERSIRQALRTIGAMQPAIVLIDEIEKSLAGVGSSGDSGVSARLRRSMMTYHRVSLFISLWRLSRSQTTNS
jgi:SpoVK/Ycf46/Vps4 family AAA+-type ATPase